MRCPNPTCRREIPFEAMDHPLCGWRASSAPAPELELEPPPTPPERMQTREEIRANVARFRALTAEVMARPTLSPLDRWRAVLDNPKSTYTAQEMARAALADLEGQRNQQAAVDKRKAAQREAMEELARHRARIPPAQRLEPTYRAMDSLAADALEEEFAAESANASRETTGSRQRPYRSGSRRA